MKVFYSDYSVRHAISAGIAVMLAVIVSYYCTFSHESCMVLGAFIAMQTTRGTQFTQALILLFIAASGLLLASLLSIFLVSKLSMLFVCLAIFVVLGLLPVIFQQWAGEYFLKSFIFVIILFVALLLPPKTTLVFQNRLMDLMLGGLIGILCNVFIFPTRLSVDFQQGVLSVINAMKDYSSLLTHYFEELNDSQPDKNYLLDKKIAIENSLQLREGGYPVWVYETGFNPGLRSGFRYFLIHIERLSELFFSLDYYVFSLAMDIAHKELALSLAKVMKHNHDLLEALALYFQHKPFTKPQGDYVSDIQQMDEELGKVIPKNLELLDISPQYTMLTALVRDMKDMRQVLLQLLNALELRKT